MGNTDALSGILIAGFTVFLMGIAYCGRNFLKNHADQFIGDESTGALGRSGNVRSIGSWDIEGGNKSNPATDAEASNEDGELGTDAKPMNLLDIVTPRGTEGEGNASTDTKGNVEVVRRVEVDKETKEEKKSPGGGLFGGGNRVSPAPSPRATDSDGGETAGASRLSQEGKERSESIPDGDSVVVISDQTE